MPDETLSTPQIFMGLTPEQWNDYYLALGRFIHYFSRAEDSLSAQILNFTTEKLGRLPPNGYQILRAVMSSGRLAHSMELLKRVVRVSKAEKSVTTALADALAHFSDIHYLRDKIAHANASPGIIDGAIWFSVSNSITGNEYEKFETISFTIEMLDAASADLDHMPTLLSCVIDPSIGDALSQSGYDVHRPWSYKPSSLKKAGQKHQRNRPERAPADQKTSRPGQPRYTPPSDV